MEWARKGVRLLAKDEQKAGKVMLAKAGCCRIDHASDLVPPQERVNESFVVRPDQD